MSKNKKINYTDEPLQMGECVADFLPPPRELPGLKKIFQEPSVFESD